MDNQSGVYGCTKSGSSSYISVEELSKAFPETQTEVMRKWFFENYEDPVESTPYDSTEGGYQYIWGERYMGPEKRRTEFLRSSVSRKGWHVQ